MQNTEPLISNNYYHIFNKGINGCDLFRETTNYEYFLNLYYKYIQPIANTYAFVLMKNHFHLLVRIKDLPGFKNLEGLTILKGMGNKPPHQYFSNLFNAYTKSYNKKYDRTGSLFEKNFHRKHIENQNYLKQVLLYIHNNPVHHGFCKHPVEYPWSSYLSCLSLKPTHLQRDAVIGWFDDLGNFKYWHDKKVEIDRIETWLAI